MSYEDRGSSLASVVVSFLAGAAIGSGLALLFAPKTGREVREQIKDLTDDAVDRIKEYAKEAQDKIKSTYECSREAVMEKKTIISSAIEAGKEAIEKEKERLNEQHKS
ncbi:MAG: YtxH domain-containing protein [Geobacteraceae bacterium]|nr:YtxH domain-containing protein [Geobacteraceae bacterium]